MNTVEFLESIRQPLIDMTGLPEGSVAIFAQQSVEQQILAAIAEHQCAVLVGITGWSGNSDRQVPSKMVTANLEIEVWTPAVITTEGGVQAMTIAEAITAGLHGYVEDGRDARNGSARVPVFQRATTTAEIKDGSQFLVISLQFDVPLTPQSLA